MQKQALFLALAAGAALFSISGYAQEAQDKRSLEDRVGALEAQLKDAQATIAGLNDAAEQGAATLDAITVYLQAQSKGAAAMAKTLQEAESQGFVAGINYPSRETLLAGWRSQLSALQKDVPGQKVKTVEKVDPWRR